MKEFESNGIEKLFKSRIEREYSAEDMWNEPSIDIFHDAMETVNSKPKSRRRFFILFFFGFIAISLSGLFYAHINSKMVMLDSKVENIELGLIDLKNKNALPKDHIETTAGESKAALLDKTANTINGSSLAEDDLNQVSQNEKLTNNQGLADQTQKFGFDSHTSLVGKFTGGTSKSKAIFNTSSDGTANSIVQSKLFGINYLTTQSKHAALVSQDGDDIPGSNESQISIQQINHNRFKLLEVPAIEAHIAPGFIHNNTNKIIDRSKLQINLFGGINFSKMCISDMQNLGHEELTSYNTLNAGSTFGGYLQYNVSNRVSIIGGLVRQKVNRYSNLKSESVYQEQLAQLNDQGELLYKMPMDLVTPLGSMNVSAEYRINTTIPSNIQSKLSMDSDINQELIVNSLALGLKYYALSQNKFSFYMSGVLNNNFLQKTNSVINSSMKMEQKEMGSMNTEFDSVMPLTTHYLSLQPEVGIEYDLFESIGIQFSGAYDFPLNSIKLIDTNISPKTSTKLINLKAGLVFKL